MATPLYADVSGVGTRAKLMNAPNAVSGGLEMGDVLLVYRIMPEDPEADLDAIVEDVKVIAEKYGSYKGSTVEKIAFGLKALKSSIIIPDEGGIVDELEGKLKSIEGIQSAEAVDITLI